MFHVKHQRFGWVESSFKQTVNHENRSLILRFPVAITSGNRAFPSNGIGIRDKLAGMLWSVIGDLADISRNVSRETRRLYNNLIVSRGTGEYWKFFLAIRFL